MSGDIDLAASHLCNAFAWRLDHGEFEALAGLFAEDGVFERLGHRLEGRASIIAAYAQRPAATTAHLVSNVHIIERDERRARGGSFALVIHAMGVSEQVLKFDPASAMRILVFEDHYVKTAEGWRFALRRPRPLLESPTWPGA